MPRLTKKYKRGGSKKLSERAKMSRKKQRDINRAEKQLASKKIKKMIEDEVIDALNKPKTRDEVADIAKKVLKRLYKDMSVQHPYMIDRIKV